MADHLKPTITSTYSNFVTELDGRFDDLAVGLDPAVTTVTNAPTNTIRWSSSSTKWQKFNGSSWADLAAAYSINISGNAATVTNGVYTSGSYSNPSWITALSGSKVTGDIAGNSGTATRLITARAINGVNFDGTAGININLNTSLTFNNSGSGATSGSAFNGGSAMTISYNSVGAPSTTGTNASGTWGISINGNAATVTNGVYNNGGTYGINITGSAGYASSAGSAATATNLDGGYVSATTITASGDITSSGNVTAYSDERLKTNWRDLPSDFITKLANLRSGIYTRTDTGEIQVGVGAQSLQQFLQHAVRQDSQGVLSVNYGSAAMVSVVELAKEILLLKAEIQKLEERLQK
jgi:uncharacterized small protein (DUF1192 family)